MRVFAAATIMLFATQTGHASDSPIENQRADASDWKTKTTQVGRKQDCFLISGVVSIVPVWRDNNVPLSRAHANIDNVLAQTGANDSEKKEWHQLVTGIYSSLVTSSEVEQQLRPTCVQMGEVKSASPKAGSISTYKNGQLIGVRPVMNSELRDAATALSLVFRDKAPSYDHLVNVAEGMTAKNRCFNLYSSRFALASIEAGKLDASSSTRVFLKDSISSFEAVNSRTQVKCEMR